MKVLTRETLFESGHLSNHLAQKSVRSGMAIMSSQGALFVVRFAGIVVLARLLSPHDYGLIGMVTVVVGFAEMFKDGGLSMATVQKEQISHEQISTLFWLNFLISAALGLCIFASSPLVSRFYGKPELTAITAALSATFLISGLTLQHQALLQRHMRFGALAIVQIASQVTTVAVTIVLACFGWRYWALVGGTLAQALSSTLLTFFFCPWIPGRMHKGVGVRNMLKFGGYWTGFNCVNYFTRNADNILIGKFIGAEALGIYGRAYQMLMLPILMTSGSLSNVAVPALCRVSGDQERLHHYYLHILYMLSLVSSPFACLAFIVSNDIVFIVLGPTWSSVGDVFRYLAIGGLLQPLIFTQSWLHLATGRSDRVFIWGLIGTPIIVGSFLIGLIWGIKGVAFCYSIAIYIATIGSLAYAGKCVNLSFKRITSAVFRPLVACVASAIATKTWIAAFYVRLSPVDSLIINTCSFLLFYAAILLLLYRGLKPFHDLVAMGNLAMAKKSA
jgi:O-antigen/teichoic acid export membrane protein